LVGLFLIRFCVWPDFRLIHFAARHGDFFAQLLSRGDTVPVPGTIRLSARAASFHGCLENSTLAGECMFSKESVPHNLKKQGGMWY
jgi:hypothetical protein